MSELVKKQCAVGERGEVVLRGDLAGRSVLVDEVREGVFVVQLATVVPDWQYWGDEKTGRAVSDLYEHFRQVPARETARSAADGTCTATEK